MTKVPGCGLPRGPGHRVKETRRCWDGGVGGDCERVKAIKVRERWEF